LIEPAHPQISIARQCDLLKMARSSYDYEPVQESEENVQLMRLLDEQYTSIPFYGTRKMTAWLQQQGYEVSRKRVTRRLATDGIGGDLSQTQNQCVGNR
jgi:putative transposase